MREVFCELYAGHLTDENFLHLVSIIQNRTSLKYSENDYIRLRAEQAKKVRIYINHLRSYKVKHLLRLYNALFTDQAAMATPDGIRLRSDEHWDSNILNVKLKPQHTVLLTSKQYLNHICVLGALYTARKIDKHAALTLTKSNIDTVKPFDPERAKHLQNTLLRRHKNAPKRYDGLQIKTRFAGKTEIHTISPKPLKHYHPAIACEPITLYCCSYSYIQNFASKAFNIPLNHSQISQALKNLTKWGYAYFQNNKLSLSGNHPVSNDLIQYIQNCLPYGKAYAPRTPNSPNHKLTINLPNSGILLHKAYVKFKSKHQLFNQRKAKSKPFSKLNATLNKLNLSWNPSHFYTPTTLIHPDGTTSNATFIQRNRYNLQTVQSPLPIDYTTTLFPSLNTLKSLIASNSYPSRIYLPNHINHDPSNPNKPFTPSIPIDNSDFQNLLNFLYKVNALSTKKQWKSNILKIEETGRIPHDDPRTDSLFRNHQVSPAPSSGYDCSHPVTQGSVDINPPFGVGCPESKGTGTASKCNQPLNNPNVPVVKPDSKDHSSNLKTRDPKDTGHNSLQQSYDPRTTKPNLNPSSTSYHHYPTNTPNPHLKGNPKVHKDPTIKSYGPLQGPQQDGFSDDITIPF
ncbi:MAG: hypothetical protein KatS3mg054_0042 [Chloroflexus sp.]|nr:MAG: hypothetical protein KatS3mg054_0042 [Chloroflexus sp.]